MDLWMEEQKMRREHTPSRGEALLRRLPALFPVQIILMMILMTICSLALADTALDDEVTRIFKIRKTAGGMVLAAKDGEIVYSHCYGFADRIAEERVTEDTYFKLASVSKLVTAVPVMQLVDRGLLDLDMDLGQVLGDPPFHAASAKFKKTTLTCRMLMTHTASIKDSGGFSNGKKLSYLLDPTQNKNAGGFLKTEPGTAYKYSNYGAGILGCVLEKVTGQRLTNAVKDLLFDPLGIDAAYDPSLLADPSRIVTTYKSDGKSLDITRSFRLKQPYDEEINVDTDYNQSYGGVWMKGRDLCRIGILLCEGGMLEGTRYLEEATVQEMLSSQKGKGGITIDSPYGLNVERVTSLMSDRMIYGHQGLANGVLCSLYFDPETHFVFTLVTNGCNVLAKQNRICSLSRQLFTLMWDSFNGN